MKTFQKIIVSFALLLSLLLPQVVVAQKNTNVKNTNVKNTNVKNTNNSNSSTSSDTCAELKKKFENAGGTNVIANVPEYCTVESVYAKFITTALYAIGIVAVIAIIYGGYLYMTARGNAEQAKKGRSVLTWAIIGLIVVLAAAVIVNIVVSGLVENRFV